MIKFITSTAIIFSFLQSTAALEDGQTPTTYGRQETAAAQCDAASCAPHVSTGTLTEVSPIQIKNRVAGILAGRMDSKTQDPRDNK
jgi:hypothetical protein